MTETWDEGGLPHGGEETSDVAWDTFRSHLIEHLEELVSADEMRMFNISAERETWLSVGVMGQRITVFALGAAEPIFRGTQPFRIAQEVTAYLREVQEVLHPGALFVPSGIINRRVEQDRVNDVGPQIRSSADEPAVLGEACDAEELAGWVGVVLSEQLQTRVEQYRPGAYRLQTPDGHLVSILVHNEKELEITSQLDDAVRRFEESHRFINDTSKLVPAFKFHVDERLLVMSRTVHARPFVRQHLVEVLETFVARRDDFAWIPTTLRKLEADHDAETIARLETKNEELRMELAALKQQSFGEPRFDPWGPPN